LKKQVAPRTNRFLFVDRDLFENQGQAPQTSSPFFGSKKAYSNTTNMAVVFDF
jgi:hypothetical protein